MIYYLCINVILSTIMQVRIVFGDTNGGFPDEIRQDSLMSLDIYMKHLVNYSL